MCTVLLLVLSKDNYIVYVDPGKGAGISKDNVHMPLKHSRTTSQSKGHTGVCIFAITMAKAVFCITSSAKGTW